LCFAMAVSLLRLKMNRSAERIQICLSLACLSAGLGMIFSPRFVYHVDSHPWASAERLFALIPPQASLRAQSTLIPHLALRHDIQSFPAGALENDEITSLENPSYVAIDQEGDSFPFTHDLFLEAVAKLKNDYQMIFSENGLELWKRKKIETPIYTVRP